MYILSVFSVCFAGLFVFERDTYNRIKNVSTILLLKVKMNFSLQNLWNSTRSKWDIYLHTCPLHLKLIVWCQYNEETRNNTLTTYSIHNWKEILLNISDYLTWNISQLVVICHVCLCIIINHSLSLFHCRKHKPTFQIINNWWLKY